MRPEKVNKRRTGGDGGKKDGQGRRRVETERGNGGSGEEKGGKCDKKWKCKVRDKEV